MVNFHLLPDENMTNINKIFENSINSNIFLISLDSLLWHLLNNSTNSFGTSSHLGAKPSNPKSIFLPKASLRL